MNGTDRSIAILAPLIAAFAMAPVAPEAGNVLFLIAGGLSVLAMRTSAFGLLGRPIVWMPLVALLLLGSAYGFGSGQLVGLVGIVYFAPIIAIWPLLSFVGARRVPDPVVIAVICLCGAAGAAVVSIGEVITSGAFRAGETVANPIHFADLAVSVGFVATLGMAFVRRHWRYVFLAGPLLGATAAVLSGTRGAIVAIVIMILVAALVGVLTRVISLKVVLAGGAALLVAGAAAFFSGAQQLSGISRIVIDIGDVLRSGVPADYSTELRLQFGLGGFRAFLQSPIFGHGLGEFTVVAGRLADVPFEGVPHLHNDAIDFAASAGIIGLVAYFLLLLAPLAEVLSARRSPTRAQTIVVMSALTAGYFVMGLTNAMFGILNVTTCFAAIAVVAGLLAQVGHENSYAS